MEDSSSVDCMVGSSSVGRMMGSSSVDDVYNNAKIGVASGTAVISTIGPANFDWANKAALILSENATYRNCIERTIYQSGDWKLALVVDGTPIGGGQV